MIRSNRSVSAIALVLAMAVGPAVALAQNAAVQGPPPAAPAPKAPAASPVNVAAIALKPEQVALLRQALDQAPAQGLGDKSLAPPQLDGLLKSADPAARQRGETLLKVVALRYAAAVHRGRLAASEFDDEWGLRPAAYDPAPGFQAAVSQDRLGDWLASLPPAYAGYQQLVKALAAYRGIDGRGGWKAVPAGDTLNPGDEDPRVPALRDRLMAEDPNSPVVPASNETYDPATVEAVKAFQRRHGLKDDGIVGRPTLAALNVPVQDRISQISANMERWRWLPDELPADRVQVNIAAAVVTLFKQGQPVLSMKAVAGKPSDHTPMLQSQIRAIVFNPPWNVPDSIARKEIYPKEKAHPGYLAREDFRVIKTSTGERLQQRAGPKSALGQVKFDFENPYGVYLHDTPAHAAFDRPTRTVSHGCVRLEKPKELAAQLLQGQALPGIGEWSPQSIDGVIAAADTRRVAVAKPVSVLIFYWTAFVGPDGAVSFTSDPYDWDHELLQKISEQKYSHA